MGKITAVLIVVAILTLLVGNLAALPQKNFKRLLAYSSIGHSGFLLMALASAPRASVANAMSPTTVVAFYLGAYLLMTLLAFLVLSSLRVAIPGEEIDSYRGLAKRSPFHAAALLVSMYFSEPAKGDESTIRVSPLTAFAMVVLMILIVVAGVAPGVIVGLFS